MNDYLNAQQLAFVLDIKKEDARAKMCNAWCKANNIPNVPIPQSWGESVKAKRDKKKKVQDDYPVAMPIVSKTKVVQIPELV